MSVEVVWAAFPFFCVSVVAYTGIRVKSFVGTLEIPSHEERMLAARQSKRRGRSGGTRPG